MKQVFVALMFVAAPMSAHAQALDVGDAGGSTTRATISTRSASILPTLPVPAFRPSTSNTAIALDLIPNGSPGEFSTNGFTWFDACDADILATSAAVHCARVGMRTTASQFGTVWYNGATPLPGELIYGQGNPVFRWDGGAFYPYADLGADLGATSKRIAHVYTSAGDLVAEVNALKARVTALESH